MPAPTARRARACAGSSPGSAKTPPGRAPWTSSPTAARFVAKARLALACALLAETNLRIGSVAVRSGFESSERMRRAFQRSVGRSPRDYSTGSGTIRM
jgi:AraC-like DNA-binding protein